MNDLRTEVLSQVKEHGPTATWAVALALGLRIQQVAPVLRRLFDDGQILRFSRLHELGSGVVICRWSAVP